LRDPVDSVLTERAQLDRGFKSSVWLSLGVHFLIVGSVFGAQLVMPKQPPIQVVDGFAVVLPRGGGGVPDAPPPAPAPEPPSEPVREEAAPEPEPPPQVIKPPTPERQREREGPPEPAATPAPRRTRPTPPPATARGLPGGAGTGSQTPGVDFAPAGPGIPGGVDQHGDWYLAGVQRKIWMIWTQQINADFQQSVRVQFTILADGSVTDVSVVQSAGAPLLDLAAKRAVVSAAPFGRFPREYGGADRITIQANFKPTR
jgi:TonB family protein